MSKLPRPIVKQPEELGFIAWLRLASSAGFFDRNLKAVYTAVQVSRAVKPTTRHILLFLEGPPGSGKTTLYDYLSLVVCEGESVTVHILQEPFEGVKRPGDKQRYLHVHLDRADHPITIAAVAHRRRCGAALLSDLVDTRAAWHTIKRGGGA